MVTEQTEPNVQQLADISPNLTVVPKSVNFADVASPSPSPPAFHVRNPLSAFITITIATSISCLSSPQPHHQHHHPHPLPIIALPLTLWSCGQKGMMKKIEEMSAAGSRTDSVVSQQVARKTTTAWELNGGRLEPWQQLGKELQEA
ncbi:hypothetical protein CRG98_024165 [Punica granatum]|uniref:Uncharacterized protein n=1 Tax=Punica granatum TaxID=22663 RepID=A0A2I0JGT5_PUNGR|nr:hypothetical protein CRG98_024165 [Punica granatum]